MTQVDYDKLVMFPPGIAAHGTLTPLERSLLGYFILMTRPKTILELGVFEASTTEFMCEFMALNGIEGRVIGFDLPDVIAGLRISNPAVQRLEQEARLELVPGWLPSSLDQWLTNSNVPVDLALVDAMHDYPSVTGELRLIWPRLGDPSAVVLCHDYSAKYDGVRYAVDRFARTHHANLLPLIPTQKAIDAGHSSVLVALAKPQYRFSSIQWIKHLWLKTKTDLIRNPHFRHIWFQYLRPIVKPESR